MPDPSTPCEWATSGTAVSVVAHLQGGRPAAVLYLLVYPMLYGYDCNAMLFVENFVLK